jgi:hypothetical protein
MRIIRFLFAAFLLLPAALRSQVPDFQVNESGGPGTCPHQEPVLVQLPGGSSLLLWKDSRNGTEQVFGQRLTADGAKDGANFLFSDLPLELSGIPAVGCDPDGRIVAARIVYESAAYTLWARRFSADGSAPGPFFRVDDDAEGGYKNYVSVACGPSGEFAISWVDTRNGVEDLYLQLYSPSAEALGGNIRVTDRKTTDDWVTSPFFPSLSFDGEGRIALAWGSNVGIFYCRCNPDGSRIGSVSGPISDATIPIVQTDGTGDVMIYYTANDGSQPKLLTVPPAGTPVVTRSLPIDFFFPPYIRQCHTFSANQDGSFLVAGLEAVSGQDWTWQLVGARFPADPAAAPDTFHVARFDEQVDYLSCGVLRPDGSSAFVWSVSNRVFSAVRGPAENARARTVQASDDTLDASHHAPAMDVDAEGGFAVTWDDERDGQSVHVKSFNADGSPRFADRRMTSDEWNTRAYNTTVTFTTRGRILAFWKLVQMWVGGQVFEPDGTPLGGNITANDHVTCEVFPVADSDSSGRAVVVWEGDPGFASEQSDVCARRFGTDGQPAGQVMRVNEHSAGMGTAEPDLAVARDGRFVIAWYDEIRRATRARIFEPNGSALGPSFDVLPVDFTGGFYGLPRVWTDAAGNITVAVYNGSVFVIRMDRNGTALGPAVKLMENVDLAGMDMDSDGRMAIALYTGDGIAGQIVTAGGVLQGLPFPLTHGAVLANRYQCAVKLRGGKVYAAWPDGRTPGRGVNVWASVTDAATAVPLAAGTLPGHPVLGTNYPNPFNPGTRFTYELRAPTDVTLEVFNVLGRRVSLITRKRMPSGVHEASWNGLDERHMPAPSGVYILRLRTDGYSATRKMVLQR